MTTSTRPADSKLTAVRAAFIGFFGLALGLAGVLVAAVAVAVERAHNGDDTVDPAREKTGSSGWWDQWRSRQSQTRAQREANAKRWLAEDKQARSDLTARRRQWVASGADPAVEPKKPGYASRLGRGTRRVASRTRVASGKVRTKASDFKKGFKEGWSTASENADKGFRVAAKTRPGGATVPDGGEPVDAEIIDEQRGETTLRPADPAPTEPATDSTGRSGSDEPVSDDDPPAPVPADDPPAAAEPATTTTDDAAAAPDDSITTETGAPDMALPANASDVKANSNPQAVDGDDHLDRISAGLGQMGATLAQGDEHTDALMALARTLRAQAAATMERAGDKATTATRQACDQALAQAAAYEEAATKVGEASAACAEQITAADEGLNPGRHARDNLHTAGATGELLAQASDG